MAVGERACFLAVIFCCGHLVLPQQLSVDLGASYSKGRGCMSDSLALRHPCG
jgi:hypothetical protein